MADWVAEELAKMAADTSLDGVVFSNPELFHATRDLEGVQAAGALIPLKMLRATKSLTEQGFGHAGLLLGDDYVSVTTSRERGVAYFQTLLVLAGVAECLVTVDHYLGWYLARWGTPMRLLAEVAAGEEGTAMTLGASLENLGIATIGRKPLDVAEDAVAALTARTVDEQLAWLLDTDKALMTDEVSAECGLGIVGAEARSLSSLRVTNTALVVARLPKGAVGNLNESEEEIRIRGRVGIDRIDAVGTTELLQSLCQKNHFE